jgi:hypothetical protein
VISGDGRFFSPMNSIGRNNRHNRTVAISAVFFSAVYFATMRTQCTGCNYFLEFIDLVLKPTVLICTNIPRFCHIYSFMQITPKSYGIFIKMPLGEIIILPAVI